MCLSFILIHLNDFFFVENKTLSFKFYLKNYIFNKFELKTQVLYMKLMLYQCTKCLSKEKEIWSVYYIGFCTTQCHNNHSVTHGYCKWQYFHTEVRNNLLKIHRKKHLFSKNILLQSNQLDITSRIIYIHYYRFMHFCFHNRSA